MNRESFLETIRTQYSDDILEAYKECSHGGSVDWKQLAPRLTKMLSHARSEGLPQAEFEDLVRTLIPGSSDHIKFTVAVQAA